MAVMIFLCGILAGMLVMWFCDHLKYGTQDSDKALDHKIWDEYDSTRITKTVKAQGDIYAKAFKDTYGDKTGWEDCHDGNTLP